MTRRDYVLMAQAINGVYRSLDDELEKPQREAVEAVVNNLCHHLAMDNPRFDRARFIEAALKED